MQDLPMAERVGFEPTVPFGTRALQARALGQTTLPLPSAEYGGDYTTLKDADCVLKTSSFSHHPLKTVAINSGV